MANTTTKRAPAKKAAPKKARAGKAAAPKAVKAPIAAGALEAKVYTMAGKESGSVSLPVELFGARWNADLVHQVVTGMQANARQVTAHTKFRGEVAGGGKKPWKQKGTGRARHGSTRSPIWVGGGTTHGPRTEKVYAVKLNKKMRSAALASVLSKKFKDGEVIFVDSLSFAAPKTKEAHAALAAIAKASGNATLATKRKNAAVLAFAGTNANAAKSFRNMGNVISEDVRNLNPVDLVSKKFLVIENPSESLKTLSARLAK